VKNELIKGFSDGFSGFVGLSLSNSMWIADYDSEYNITNEELVYFRAGDCLILPYDTLHAGDKNSLSVDTFKIFTDVFTKKKQSSDSQLWLVEGGFSRTNKH
jgi:hypothetical protein